MVPEVREDRRLPPRSVSAIACTVLLGFLVFTGSHVRAGDPPSTSSTPAVKLSRGGICHDSASQHFARLKAYQPFYSMEECVAAGGRPFRAATKKPGSPTDVASGGQQSERRPDQDGSKEGVPIIVWWGVAGIVILVFGIPWLRRWRLRRKNQETEARFNEAAERHWRGHHLDRPKDPNEQGPMKPGE